MGSGPYERSGRRRCLLPYMLGPYPLVAQTTSPDLFICAKHLLVAAIGPCTPHGGAQLDHPAFLVTWGGPFVFETVQSVAAENCWRRLRKAKRA